MEINVDEQDWRLFKKCLPFWQENYIKRLNQEYIQLLSGGGEASEKFWLLGRKIREDKKSVGVIAEVTRKKMETNMIALIRENVIGWDDLEGFSEKLIKRIEYLVKNF